QRRESARPPRFRCCLEKKPGRHPDEGVATGLFFIPTTALTGLATKRDFAFPSTSPPQGQSTGNLMPPSTKLNENTPLTDLAAEIRRLNRTIRDYARNALRTSMDLGD